MLKPQKHRDTNCRKVYMSVDVKIQNDEDVNLSDDFASEPENNDRSGTGLESAFNSDFL